MSEQKTNYFIDKFWVDYQKLKDGDIEYCFPFYECLVKHYQKRNVGNKNFNLLLRYVSHERFISSVDWYKGTLTEQIVGDNYICRSGDILSLSNSPSVGNNDFASGPDIPYLNLDYGTLKFSNQAFDFIKNPQKPSENDNGKDKRELISFDKSSSQDKVAYKILRFTKAEVYAEAYKGCIKTICGYLAKSVTVGEYLIIDDYSEKYLDPVFNWRNNNISGLSDSNLTDELYTDGFLGQMLNDIGAAASKLRSMCRTMGKILENHQSPEKHPIRVVGFKNDIPFSFGEITNADISCLWPRTIEAISLIAYIDFAYFSTFQNIETLCTSREILKQLRNAYRGDSMVEKEIVIPNIVKASKMLHDSIVFHDKSETDLELERKILLQDNDTDQDIRDSGLFHGFPEKTFKYSEAIKQLKFSEEGYKDLCRYHKIGYDYLSIKKRGKKLCDISKKELKTIIDKNDFDVIKAELNNDDVWTMSLLVKTIRRLTLWVEDKLNENEASSVCDAALNLLRRLERRCFEYEKGNIVPGKIETSFQNSFYYVSCDGLKINNITGYNFERQVKLDNLANTVEPFSGKSVMFMQSISATPVALNFLFGFIKKYDRRVNKVALRKSSQQLSAVENIRDTLDQKFKDNQSHSLQLLGILGAFIALISVGANALSDVPVERFFVFLAVVTGCVIALLLCISFVFEKKSWIRHVGLSLLLIAIITTLCIVSKSESNVPAAEEASKWENVSTGGMEYRKDSIMIGGRISVRIGQEEQPVEMERSLVTEIVNTMSRTGIVNKDSIE